MARAQRKKVGKAKTTRARSAKKPKRNSRGQFASKAQPLPVSRALRSYGRDDERRRDDREREPLEGRSERYADGRYARENEPYDRYADERLYARDDGRRYGRDAEQRYGRDTEQPDGERRPLRDDGYRYRRDDEHRHAQRPGHGNERSARDERPRSSREDDRDVRLDRREERRYDTEPEEEDISWGRDRDWRKRDSQERANGRW